MHTKEPWLITDAPHELQNAEGELIAKLTKLDMDNARRIVACINTCANIDTGLLEEADTRYFQRQSEQFINIKQQRDELLSTLKLLHSAEWMVSNYWNESRAHIVERVEEVLAKHGE